VALLGSGFKPSSSLSCMIGGVVGR
jgi:hypothetical protein